VRVDQGDLSVLDGLDVILEIPISPNFFPEHLENELRIDEAFVQYFLLDFTRHGLDWAFIAKDIDFWERICRGFPVLLAFDFTPENLPQILEALAPAGIVLRGGSEEKVGVKSFDELDEVFEVLGIED
jgi:phosphoribosylanthranilate isomerase